MRSLNAAGSVISLCLSVASERWEWREPPLIGNWWGRLDAEGTREILMSLPPARHTMAPLEARVVLPVPMA